LQGRTISATVWGVVGYAIGTILGVGMYRLVGG
jgi:TPP-dependent 2-oxoacid decarboxylase